MFMVRGILLRHGRLHSAQKVRFLKMARRPDRGACRARKNWLLVSEPGFGGSGQNLPEK